MQKKTLPNLLYYLDSAIEWAASFNHKYNIQQLLIGFCICYAASGHAQNDTITLTTGKTLYGEIKNIKSKVLTLKTSYSDSDFKIDFKKVSKLNIQRRCFVLLTKGRRRTGYIKSRKENYFTICSEDQNNEQFALNELISLNELSDDFWHRLSFDIDLSYNHTKANNASQFVVEGHLEYRDLKWIANTTFSSLKSKQDNTENIQRTEIKSDLKRILPKKWYLLNTLSFLSNTEQSINSRYNISIGIGRYLLFTKQLSLGVNFGLNYNIEDIDNSENNNTSEFYFGTDFNMFDFKDFELTASLNSFLSGGDRQRFRSDFNINLKYDLPMDLYLKSGFKFNYDNQAANTGSDFDYLFTTGVGWSYN